MIDFNINDKKTAIEASNELTRRIAGKYAMESPLLFSESDRIISFTTVQRATNDQKRFLFLTLFLGSPSPTFN